MKAAKLCFVAALGFLVIGCGEKPLTEYSNPAGKFKILFPGSPHTQTVKGLNNINVNVFSVESSSGAYVLNYYDSPLPLAGVPVSEEVKGFYSGLNGQKQTENAITLQEKYSGAEHTGTVTKPKNFNARGRSFIVGNRVYNVVVIGDAEKVKSETATKFLDSFKVDP
jgi:hypothetical protein